MRRPPPTASQAVTTPGVPLETRAAAALAAGRDRANFCGKPLADGPYGDWLLRTGNHDAAALRRLAERSDGAPASGSELETRLAAVALTAPEAALESIPAESLLRRHRDAALAYESSRSGARKALAHDLGGGTFDISVVNLENDVVEVLASHGNNHIGGDDFDQQIVKPLVQHLEQTHAVDVRQQPLVMARLLRAAEAAKIALSDQPYTMLSDEYLFEKDGVPIQLSLELSRLRYEEMIEPVIAETIEAVRVELNGAGLTVAAINGVLLVGGATRTPMVQRRLEEDLGMPPRADRDPDLCVAMGAASMGDVCASRRRR
ncbi:Hsp70 family protein [Accumulibacter sp.]|uniref:Hsp70 family protein n=1 Tax=Accumulibacter sp. TaxID=2053492 RepID=UPI0025FA8982|nr:Hsp70 family protein [Accumulibacter sp.]MCM8594902.1 Hsp70 family protein [Accumulibacter sp.]MCM8627844.1 Hsp70 family protein [Accumulibacter sp.]MDS4049048.1 Hsp70 family protein [Accumulibacter sp.]